MEVLNNRGQLHLEPGLEHLEAPFLRPVLLVSDPTLQHRLEQVGPEVLQDSASLLRLFPLWEEIDVGLTSKRLEDGVGESFRIILTSPFEERTFGLHDDRRSIDHSHSSVPCFAVVQSYATGSERESVEWVTRRTTDLSRAITTSGA